ncbi:MAG: TonB family protein [Gemmatimonadaceae bacterium]
MPFRRVIPLLLLAAAPCLAQTDTAPAAAPACTAPPAVTGEGDHPVHLLVWRVEKGTLAPPGSGRQRDLLSYVLQEIGSRFATPSELEVAFEPGTVLRLARDAASDQAVVITAYGPPRRSSWDPSPPLAPELPPPRRAAPAPPRDTTARSGPRDVEAWPTLHAQLRFTLHQDGAVSEVATTRRSVVPALDSALAVALRESGAARSLAGAVRRALPDADSVTLALELRADDDTTSASGTVARVRLPHHRLTTPALTGGMSVRYPERERNRQREGRVVIDYVVRADGSTDPMSWQPREGTTEFVRAVARALPALRFRPALAGGCAVATELRHTWDFQVER